MKKIVIEIRTENAAFDEDPATEVARILHQLAEAAEQGHFNVPVRDYNGNVVGKMTTQD